MPSHPPSRIRNVALVGHNGAGKTTLAEALLFATGADHPAGQGRGRHDRVATSSPRRSSATCRCRWRMAPFTVGDVKINLIDTPGYADFFGEVRAACSVVDLVVVVVSAVEGVEAQTERRLALAAELGCPGSCSSTSSTGTAPASTAPWPTCRSASAPAIAPLELPIGRGVGLPGDRRPPHRLRHPLRGRKPTTGPDPRRPRRPSSTRSASSSSRGSWSATTP